MPFRMTPTVEYKHSFFRKNSRNPRHPSPPINKHILQMWKLWLYFWLGGEENGIQAIRWDRETNQSVSRAEWDRIRGRALSTALRPRANSIPSAWYTAWEAPVWAALITLYLNSITGKLGKFLPLFEPSGYSGSNRSQEVSQRLRSTVLR